MTYIEMTDDEQEAKSVRYVTPRVAALSSGKFAVFHPFDNEYGIPIKIICSFEELWEAIKEQQEENAAEDRPFKTAPQSDLLTQLGLSRASKLVRRI